MMYRTSDAGPRVERAFIRLGLYMRYIYDTERDLRRSSRGRDGTSPLYLLDAKHAAHGQRVSPWNDVPLRLRGGSCVTMVCEVPKGTRAKYEVTVDEPPLHPIRRDVTNDGESRSYPSPMPWNYGMMPRTWEDPGKIARLPITGMSSGSETIDAPGDGDPLDVVEVGSSSGGRRMRVGQVCEVRALGALALIDGGELDWKVVAIRTDDPLVASGRVKTAGDLEREIPGTVERIRRWFVEYKPGSGNRYAFGGKLMAAAPVIREANAAWKAHVRNRRGQKAIKHKA